MIEQRMETRIQPGRPMPGQYDAASAFRGLTVREAAIQPNSRAFGALNCKPNGDPDSLVLWGSEEDGPAGPGG